MPWSNQGGGPWGSGGSTPPDLEEFLRRSQDRLRTVLPGGSFGGKGIVLAAVAAVLIWLGSGFYRVDPNEYGVVLRFGAQVRETPPGLNYHWPYPIETVLTPQVTVVRPINIGMRLVEDLRRGTTVRDVPEESLMLTGDENIVDVDFVVFWQIKNASDYLFNIQNPEGTVKDVAESAMREIVGQGNIEPILTEARAKTEASVQELMQQTLDSYGAGVLVRQVQLQKVDPPQQVIDAFRDVQAARADKERLQNEARAYANRVIQEAKGDAERILQAAQGYRGQVIAESKGEADRFLKVYEQYKLAPEVTRKRMFIETMQHVLGDTDKVIIDQKAGQGVVPYLPLPEFSKRPPSPEPQQ